ncbi:MAG TPA: hypothetical protein PK364_15055, partial [Synergistaceae bacterium]|nr:hypothetical protein [Synergistaceae bacterium]
RSGGLQPSPDGRRYRNRENPRNFPQQGTERHSLRACRKLPEKKELRSYALVISCAGCMVTRNVMMHNLQTLRDLSIPALNYGMFFAWTNGLFPRALLPIPSVTSLLQ